MSYVRRQVSLGIRDMCGSIDLGGQVIQLKNQLPWYFLILFNHTSSTSISFVRVCTDGGV